ncbi:uncharacterized protein LOC141969450 isoform X3 [Athene noctua]|uniref:uncharacterized protein LOC141969450 isoform X3 n=1 Tax=Athene noctua TaxID=126797 RepID=UPI003EB9B9F6
MAPCSCWAPAAGRAGGAPGAGREAAGSGPSLSGGGCWRRSRCEPREERREGEDWSHGRRREERRSEVVNFPGSAESDGCGTASDNGSSVDSGASVLQKTHRKPETRKHPSRPMRLLRKTAMALQKLSVIGPPGFQKENL